MPHREAVITVVGSRGRQPAVVVATVAVAAVYLQTLPKGE